MNIELTKQEVEAVMQRLAVMPYNQVAELIAFFNGKINPQQAQQQAPQPIEKAEK